VIIRPVFAADCTLMSRESCLLETTPEARECPEIVNEDFVTRQRDC
jgi:hypothetical protein